MLSIAPAIRISAAAVPKSKWMGPRPVAQTRPAAIRLPQFRPAPPTIPAIKRRIPACRCNAPPINAYIIKAACARQRTFALTEATPKKSPRLYAQRFPAGKPARTDRSFVNGRLGAGEKNFPLRSSIRIPPGTQPGGILIENKKPAKP